MIPIAIADHDRKGSRPEQRAVDAIFRRPLAESLAWRDVVALVGTIGEVCDRRDGKVVFRIGAAHLTMKRPHGNHLLGADVIKLRHFLLKSCAPSSAPVPLPVDTPQADLLVAVDHHKARVYHLDVGSQDVAKHSIRPYDPHHFLHHLSHRNQPREHGQRAHEDAGFYEEISLALEKGNRIVVIGHGAGHSNAAAHLAEHLRLHHHDTFAHLESVVTADFRNMTRGELLAAGRKALLDAGPQEAGGPA
jgi:hypothetical protein